MFTIENYKNSLIKGLETKSSDLIARLKATTQFTYYKEIDLLDFTAFVQSFELSIVMFSMDGDANEVFYEGTDEGIFSGSYNVMDDVTYYTFSDEESDEFWDFYEKNDEKLSEIEMKVIVEWFATCWNKAGGKNVTLLSYFSFHDYDECYDLHNGKWISDGDKWFD
ncbi:hypothetical protein COE20_12375 [Bacillus cereus]|uniref:hypothetical protein n=1 Tax=Bacillus cereus group TaxID=86661 RepID=UPI000BEBCBF6|nr:MULTISPECIES: hypothetical protein [Bacillus cereus group]PDZ02200.1 hypothetical protein CON03_30450 [Bacillus cereus]PEC56668.1 hypothetical protein CON05_02495 [Bacillus cereus]PFE45124.1 hypothetical protein CN317_20500 [Bacillus cereus]PFN15292.1 hypothetical protein COJ72_12655 [Bacillus cereus]PFS81321.1 hypothetical protein COK56_10325 [Bacillus cereus]